MADQRLSFHGSQRNIQDRRFDVRGRARRPFPTAVAFRPRTLGRDDPPRERETLLPRMRMRHVEERDRWQRPPEMDLQRMRQDGFLHDIEASVADEAERQEMADVREMRAGRGAAPDVRRGMRGHAEDRFHA